MMETTFTDKMIKAITEKQSVLNVGLDPQLKFMPPRIVESCITTYGKTFKAIGCIYSWFNKEIIDAVAPYIVSVKPQIAFYEMYGADGIEAFERTIAYAKEKGLIVITDAKRGDGGDTAQAYADGHIGQVPFFDNTTAESPIRVDALTVHGYIGTSCVQPFLAAVQKHGTGVFIVDKTSFSPNSEIEQMKVQPSGLTVWEELAQLVADWGKDSYGSYGYRNFGVVMGATYPTDAPRMRKILPSAWFLIPGYGEQGGGADGAVVGINDDGFGGIVSTSRAVIAAWTKGQFKCYPKDFAGAAARAAEFSRDELNAALRKAGKARWLSRSRKKEGD